MKLLVTGAWKASNEQLNTIKSLGHEIVFMQQEKDALPCSYEQVEGVICNGLFLHHDFNEFVNLKFVQLTSAGFDRVPMDLAKEKGIPVYNAGNTYAIPMAEFAINGVLSLYKQSAFFNENKRSCIWEKHRNLLELFSKTVLIVGCGNVGTECAKRFRAFGCKVLGVDLYPRKDENYFSMDGMDNLDDNLKIADVVVLTLPLTKETKGMFNKERFDKMKDNSLLVNIARGAIVDENALIDALNNKLFGAVIDVFNEEPLSTDSPLWKMENLILTPHNAFVGEGNSQRLFNLIIKNLKG